MFSILLSVAIDLTCIRDTAATSDGLVTDWLVCGPFPSGEMTVFYEDQLKELGGEQAVAPTEGMTVTTKSPYKGIDNWYEKVMWQKHHTKEDGYVDFAALYLSKPSQGSQKIAYAFCTIESPEKRRVLLEVRTDDALQVWVNHREVIYNHLFRGGWRQGGVDLIVVDLEKGSNLLLVKVGDYRYTGWGFAMRVVEAHEKIYVHQKDILLPHLRVGERLAGWASISLVNTTPDRLDRVTVEVKENDLFSHKMTSAQPLELEWDSRVAFWLETKRKVTLSD